MRLSKRVYRTRVTCQYCGALCGFWGKAEHYHTQHPEFKFHAIGDGKQLCEICDRTVPLVDLARHYRVWHKEVLTRDSNGKPRYMTRFVRGKLCPACGKDVFQGSLFKHVQEIHPEYKIGYNSRRSLICGYCSTCLGSTSEGIRHVKTRHPKELIRGIEALAREIAASPLLITQPAKVKIDGAEKTRFRAECRKHVDGGGDVKAAFFESCLAYIFALNQRIVTLENDVDVAISEMEKLEKERDGLKAQNKSPDDLLRKLDNAMGKDGRENEGLST